MRGRVGEKGGRGWVKREIEDPCYGVATKSRMLKNICLFAEYRSLL